MKISKIATTIIMVSTLALAGCSNATDPAPTNEPTSIKTDSQSLIRETVDTVCALSGKTIIETTDIQSFRDMSNRLESYEGENSEQMKATAEQLNGFADNYETIVGVELPEEVAQQFVDGCVGIEESYENAYGS